LAAARLTNDDEVEDEKWEEEEKRAGVYRRGTFSPGS